MLPRICAAWYLPWERHATPSTTESYNRQPGNNRRYNLYILNWETSIWITYAGHCGKLNGVPIVEATSGKEATMSCQVRWTPRRPTQPAGINITPPLRPQNLLGFLFFIYIYNQFITTSNDQSLTPFNHFPEARRGLRASGPPSCLFIFCHSVHSALIIDWVELQ